MLNTQEIDLSDGNKIIYVANNQNDAFAFHVYGNTIDVLKIDTSTTMVAHVSIDANMEMMDFLRVDNNISCHQHGG